MISSNLGYPRIGRQREWKKALEQFWSGTLSEEAFLLQLKKIRLTHLRVQKEKGIDLIPVNDASLYDHMLDMAAMFGIVPDRFGSQSKEVSLSTYYAMARGSEQAAACEMTKWFNTNYHYIVPELQAATPKLTTNYPLLAYREAREECGIEGKPVIIGPLTFLKLSKGYQPEQLPTLVEQFIPVYVQLLQQLEQEGVSWVQLDEPILATSTFTSEDTALLEKIYRVFQQEAPRLKIMLQTYFDAVEHYETIVGLPVQGIGLDFVHGKAEHLAALRQHGFPKDKVLGAGIIDGRNIWKSNLQEKLELLRHVTEHVSQDRLILQPSCSLLHVPVSIQQEEGLDAELKAALAFADEKLDEVAMLVQGLRQGKEAIASILQENEQALNRINASTSRQRTYVQSEAQQIAAQPVARKSAFEERHKVQQQKWQLPLLPTTTIGSFPQTKEVRQARLQWRRGILSSEDYAAFIREQIKEWVHLQEELEIDVLVHGEFERTDMVEFFGEKLAGFAFTQNGWVQSYGSRCVKPPIIYGDVEFTGPMTVAESVYAQSLTDKPVKGMLTGPVTILNWSFVRDDVSRKEVVYQLALALRREVEALEAAGIEMIQVDEPALREGLPLKKRAWNEYLDWAVKAFRIATSSVQDTTQIHTHMCYCDFEDIIDAIRALDADVISIETSRSHGELISAFEHHTYDHGIGLGVYDIHSPRVPAIAEMTLMIERALRVLNPKQFWINPDCGLKTRNKEETVAALKHMVAATKEARLKYEG